MRALCAHTAGDIKDEVQACEDKENEKDCLFCLGFTLCYSLVLGVESKTRHISVCYTSEVHSMGCWVYLLQEIMRETCFKITLLPLKMLIE